MDDALLKQLDGLRARNVHLLDVEKEELRAMASEGRPLWKILKTTLDYADERMQHIASADLRTKEGLASARQLQLERNAALNFTRWFVEQFDGRNQAQRKKDLPNG